MKIGILTYHAACNFGANLQVLSTVEYFRNNSFDVEIINWYPKDLEAIYAKITPELQMKEHEKFRLDFLPLSKLCRTDDEILSVIDSDQIDAIVVGSDAVAQFYPILSRFSISSSRIFTYKHLSIDRTAPNPFWGSFLNKLPEGFPIFMMSVSSQNSPYKKAMIWEKKQMAKRIERFRVITCRDSWTSNMFDYLSDGKTVPTVTPDPVFAFNQNVSFVQNEETIRHKFSLEGRYCLLSFHNSKTVSQKWLSRISELMHEKEIKTVALPFPQGIEFKNNCDVQIDIPLSPLEWYALIKYSKYYVGDNMHPIVVCLHNAVPCFSFDHYGIVDNGIVNVESSKIYHIMHRYGLDENRVSIRGKYIEPSPEFVLSKLEEFDKVEVIKISAQLLEDYNNMMSNIITHISNV